MNSSPAAEKVAPNAPAATTRNSSAGIVPSLPRRYTKLIGTKMLRNRANVAGSPMRPRARTNTRNRGRYVASSARDRTNALTPSGVRMESMTSSMEEPYSSSTEQTNNVLTRDSYSADGPAPSNRTDNKK